MLVTDDRAVELLRRAGGAHQGSTDRKLLTAAAFASASLDDAVLVGGAAADLHTGSYRPTDIDLVGHLRPDHIKVLERLGFRRDGRHWLFVFGDGETLAIEVPGESLGDFAIEPPLVIDLQGGELAVISLNDLMMDRLLQATGGEPVTHDEAVRLAVAAYDRIDWESLETRAETVDQSRSSAAIVLPETLATVRREAVRLLRQ